jgi:hypothetical protein
MVMKRTVLVLILAVAVIIIGVGIYLHLYFYWEEVVLDEDFTNVSMVIAMSNGVSAIRYAIMDDNSIVVSHGNTAYYRNALRGLYSCEITSMAFMSSITSEAEITLGAEMHGEIVTLAEEIVRDKEGELVLSYGTLNMIIATRESVHEATYLPGRGWDRVYRLAAILREIAPIDIPSAIERSWWVQQR